MSIARKALHLLSKGHKTIYGYPISGVIDCLVAEDSTLDQPDMDGKTKLARLREEVELMKQP